MHHDESVNKALPSDCGTLLHDSEGLLTIHEDEANPVRIRKKHSSASQHDHKCSPIRKRDREQTSLSVIIVEDDGADDNDDNGISHRNKT